MSDGLFICGIFSKNNGMLLVIDICVEGSIFCILKILEYFCLWNREGL